MKQLLYVVFPLLATALACATPASDQRAADIVVLNAPLDSVTGMDAPEIATEVGDGVIVLPAPMLPGVIRINFAAGVKDSVGRAGDGPGEFRSPFFVQSMNDASVLILDGLARRVTVLDSSLAFREQFSDFGGLAPTTVRFDSLENSYGLGPVGGPAAPGDSVALLRRRGTATTLDTVAFLERLVMHPLQVGTSAMMVPAEYAPRDVWGVHRDGSIWIARGARRSLELIGADGDTSSVALPFAPIATVDADSKLFRGFPAPAELDTVARTIAPTKGPFQEVRSAPDGHLYFWLNQPAGYSQELVAEFNRQGQLMRTLALPLGSKLILAGASSLYATQESADGTWVLRRYRRPRD